MEKTLWKEQARAFKDKMMRGIPYLVGPISSASEEGYILDLRTVQAIETTEKEEGQRTRIGIVYLLENGQMFRVQQEVHVGILKLLEIYDYEPMRVKITWEKTPRGESYTYNYDVERLSHTGGR